ncbi:MAG: dockerin type I domain-containing protein [Candidatus Binatia bacterium]
MDRSVQRLLLVLILIAAIAGRPSGARAHHLYLANDNHTDYGWNATTDAYDASMLSELDYYLGRVTQTSGNPPAEQDRYNADCWYYLYLYQHNRTAAQFQALIDAMKSGHVTVPLNPFVSLYGAMPTEAAIRAGFYPGRIARQYGVSFLSAQEMENATIPWGIASIWAGSQGRYSWKGLCGCVTAAPYADRTDEVFRWQGPDNKEILMKWYQFAASNSWGGYAEARDNLSLDALQTTISHFAAQPPFLPFTGLFGAGWDDVNWETDQLVTLAQAWNAAHPAGDQVIVSNEIDYFQELESNKDALAVLRGGWGNDWDLWPAALAARTAQARDAVERLRTADVLAAIVHAYDRSFWPPRQAALEAGFVDFFKYFEHVWGEAGVGLDYVVNNKKTWVQDFDDAISQVDGDAATRLAASFTTPDGEDRFVVVNPLGFARTDYADLPVVGGGPYVVTDVAAGGDVPSQVVSRDGNTYLRILAGDVPALGYRVYRYVAGTPGAFGDAAAVSGNAIESAHYQVVLGDRGHIASAVDKTSGKEMAGTGLNDFGSGEATAAVAENVGPVSATIRVDVDGYPLRRVRVTLLRDVDRIEIDDEILSNYNDESLYRFNVTLTAPQIHFEEVGAVARPGLTNQGGDFLPGTRADFMTLNHFVDFADGAYHITLSNWDAMTMTIGNSTVTSFDLSQPEISVLATGNPSGSEIGDEGGDTNFRNRFALRGASGPFSAAAAMQASLAHTNPLRAIALPRRQTGPLTAPTAGMLAVSAPNVVIMDCKPAEDPGRGLVVQLWELDGKDTAFTIDATAFAPTTAFETSLIETDTAPAPLSKGIISASIAANEIKSYRFVPASISAPLTPPGDVDADGMVNVADLSALVAALFEPAPPSQADVNSDGHITSADIVALLQFLAID